ncbi:MAG: HlyD family type I secretion periplasmic adaptor subunit [Porticoccaceae bacterium]
MFKQQMDKLQRQFQQTPAVDLKYMSYSSEAVLKQSPFAAQALLWVIAVFILVMLIWSSLAKIDEFTRGEGKIVPSSDIQIVQNLEGGILASLLVAEGDVVDRGQPLLQIDDTIFASTYRERALQAKQLTVKAARLKAEANGSDFDAELDKMGQDISAALIASERALYDSRQQEQLSEQEILNQKVSQKYQELSSIKVNRKSLSDSYQLMRKELSFTKPLVADGAVSQVELLRLERQVTDLKGELDRAAIAIPQLEAAYSEAKKNVESHAQSFASESRAELNDVMAELGRIQQSNEALADRVQRTIVRSPMKGTVKQLKVKTIGGVIQPGMDLVEIVPFDDSLLVDARVRPADIAFIHPTQAAMVKFTAYDFSIHGGLPAKVVHISPDTIVDEEGNSYYQIRLQTESGHLGKDDEPLPIIPGMTVQVDILTGKKTILDYLLKPILKTKQLAFRER